MVEKTLVPAARAFKFKSTLIIGSLISPFPWILWECQPCMARAAASLMVLPDPDDCVAIFGWRRKKKLWKKHYIFTAEKNELSDHHINKRSRFSKRWNGKFEVSYTNFIFFILKKCLQSAQKTKGALMSSTNKILATLKNKSPSRRNI